MHRLRRLRVLLLLDASLPAVSNWLNVLLYGSDSRAGRVAHPEVRRVWSSRIATPITSLRFVLGRATLPLLADVTAQKLLGDCFREAKVRWPFEMNAVVLLPDHVHAIWSLPSGDAGYLLRWSWIKKEFTKRWLDRHGMEGAVSEGRQREGRRGVWQPRFWEHTIEDETDFERHFDYIHYNPVKHQLVKCPRDWSASSFHRWVKAGVYHEHWACWNTPERTLSFTDIEDFVGE